MKQFSFAKTETSLFNSPHSPELSGLFFQCGFPVLSMWLGNRYALLSLGLQPLSIRSQRLTKNVFSPCARGLTIYFMEIDSLRSYSCRATADDRRHTDSKVFAADTLSEFSYGVNLWRTLRVQVKTNKVSCGINGFLPTPSARVPSIYSSEIFL